MTLELLQLLEHQSKVRGAMMNNKWNLLWIAMGLLAVGCNGLSKPPNTMPSQPPVGNVPPDLVGVWRDTFASGGDNINPVTNESFSMTKGYSAKLKLTTDGKYSFEHYSAGGSSNCATVSYYDSSVGNAQFSNNQLVLHPTQRRIVIQNCANSRTINLSNDPIHFEAITSDYVRIEGERTQKLELKGIYAVNLKLLDPTKTTNPVQTTQPATFQLGQDTPYAAIVGALGTKSRVQCGLLQSANR
jgi:hypothetical protein